MRRGWLVVALLLSLGVNLGLVGAAVVRRHALERWERIRMGEERPPEGFGRRIAERLDLGEAERERFVAVQRALVERTAEGRRRIGELRRELRRELLAAAPDRPRIDALLDELGREEAALNRAFVDSVLDSREVLGARRTEAYLRFLERFAPGPGGPPPPREPFGPLRRRPGPP